ncbi:MAG: ECF-type sigma factor [Thermomonas sp.]|uniref:ECF-type sigma factor n=1 Tax=Thermomonas sp. TaxID=1971895 RepID=UPI0039E51D08
MAETSVTQWLSRAQAGESDALGQAYAAAYADLKQAAHAQLRRGSGDLDTTSLVNETWLKLARSDGFRPEDRRSLLALSAHAMRQVLVDEARRRHADKRGGDMQQVTLHTGIAMPDAAVDVLQLHDLLETLAQADPRAAEGVELRCFGGYTETEIADIQGITERTVQRDWRRARAWLMAQLA